MGIFLSYKIPSANKRPRSSKREVWCYSHGDFEKANGMLDQIDWEHIIDENNVNVSWNNWQNVFLKVMSECVPRKILPRKKHLPWITPSIHMAIKRRNSLLNTYKRTNSQLKLIQYKQVRNRVVTELRKAKQMFFRRMRDADSKSFWKLFKILTKKESSIPSFSVPGSGMITNAMEKATVLNQYFFNNFNHAYTSTDYSWLDSVSTLSPSSIPEEYLCSDEQILRLLTSLNTRKASGADGITAQMLKATGTSIIAKGITKLFNLSLKTGIFPTDWKFARVVPIPKSGNPDSPSNYRPISTLPIISKLLEKHVHNLLHQHLSENCPLSPNQWGFTEGKSTTTALLSFVHECQEALDNGGEVCSVFFDLCKAFDSVPHQPLLLKLFQLQVNPFLLRWIHNYLSNRSQSVVLDGAQSNPLPVVSGVPQGSVLGPLLFLVYIDGASNTSLHGKIAMYADDIALYSIIKNPSDYTYLQRDITSLCSWLAINHLTLNLTKCCYMLFSRKHQMTLPAADLYVGDTHALARIDHYKYLGLNFSTDLSWSHHIGLVCKKTRRLLGMLYRNFYHFSSSHILVKL